MRDWFTPLEKGSKTYSSKTEKRLLQLEIKKRKIAELVASSPERAQAFTEMQEEIDQDLLTQEDGDIISQYCDKNGYKFGFSRQIALSPGTVLSAMKSTHDGSQLTKRHDLVFASQDKAQVKAIEKEYKKIEKILTKEIQELRFSPNAEERERAVQLIQERRRLRMKKQEDLGKSIFTHVIENKDVPQHTVSAVLKNKDQRYFSEVSQPVREGLQNINEDLFRGTKYEEALNGALRTSSVRMNNLACGVSDPYAIRDDLDTLFARYQYSDLPQLEKIILLHLGIVQIQPFQDGNKKTTRLLLNGLLSQAGYPTISAMSTDCKAYRRVLCDALESGDATEMIDYIEGMVNTRSDDVLSVLKRVQADEYTQALREGWKPVKKDDEPEEVEEIVVDDNLEDNGLQPKRNPGEVPPEA